jgi:phosphoribosylformylglycinamidine (FGAM) synthase PurS component
MKLLLDGKPRNIYFKKDKTVYYKNNGIENDITGLFKKTGDLKKQHSNLLVKNEKKIIGGSNFSIMNIFDDIIIENKTGKKCWDSDKLKEVCERLLYILILVKIQFDVLNDDDDPFKYSEISLIIRYLNLIVVILKYFFNKNLETYNKIENEENEENRLNTNPIKTALKEITYDDIFTKVNLTQVYNTKVLSDKNCMDLDLTDEEEGKTKFDGIKQALLANKIFEVLI